MYYFPATSVKIQRTVVVLIIMIAGGMVIAGILLMTRQSLVLQLITYIELVMLVSVSIYGLGSFNQSLQPIRIADVTRALNSAGILIVCPDWEPLNMLADLVARSFSRRGIRCIRSDLLIKFWHNGRDPFGRDIDSAAVVEQMKLQNARLVLILTAQTTNGSAEDVMYSVRVEMRNRNWQSTLEPGLLAVATDSPITVDNANRIVETVINRTRVILRVEAVEPVRISGGIAVGTLDKTSTTPEPSTSEAGN